MFQIIKTADRNLLVRGMTADTVVFDVIFTKNDALDVAEAASEGFGPEVQRNPNRFLTAPLSAFTVRAAQAGYYLRSDDKTIQGLIDAQIKAHFS